MVLVPRVAAQQWNDGAVRALVGRAVQERAADALDASLQSYSARAHGILTFHAEFDPRFGPGARLVRADELDVEVYWERPDRSKQVIRAWRDSTFFPTDLAYHRDHLGIVSNDFGPRIRIGDGDEVSDVVHPLAPDGPDWYDYRLRDTVRISTAGRRLVLAGIDVRPRDPSRPGVAGTLYLDVERAQVVRFRFTFTAAAFRDRNLEDLTVRLERSLVDDRYWLPYHQEIEIRRRSAVVDFPLRGVIRGRWDIGDYRVNAEPPVRGPGSWIGGLRAPGGPSWTGPLTAQLDSTLTPMEGADLARIRAAAREVVGHRLTRPAGIRLGLSRTSDLFRWNRVEGPRVGAGLSGQGCGLDRVTAVAGVGLGDGRLTGGVDLSRQIGSIAVGLDGSHRVVDVGDQPPSSSPANTIAGLVGGRDLGDYVMLDRVGLRVGGPLGSGGTTFQADAVWERPVSVEGGAGSVWGHPRANPALGSRPYWIGRLGLARGPGGTGSGLAVDLRGEVGAGPTTYGRVAAGIAWTGQVTGGEWRVEGVGGASTGGLPARRAFLLGGVGTLPGEPFRSSAGRALVLGRLDRGWALPGPSVGLGAFGRTVPTMLLGPFVAVGRTFGRVDGPWSPGARWGLVAGLTAQLFDRAIRLEVGRGFGAGRVTTVGIDIDRRWWPIL